MGLISTLIAPPSKPKVPPFVPVDTTAEQAAAIAGNIKNLPAAEQFASQLNSFLGSEWLKSTDIGFPQFKQASDNIGRNIVSQTAGEVPQDVQDWLQRSAAVNSLYKGYGPLGGGGSLGPSMGLDEFGRNFGLTSLAIKREGQDAATRWMAATRTPQVDLSSMFMSASDRIRTTQWNKEFSFNRDWTKNQIKAMPDPFLAALGNSLDAMVGGAASAAGSIMGMYGGGGATGGQSSGGGGGGL